MFTGPLQEAHHAFSWTRFWIMLISIIVTVVINISFLRIDIYQAGLAKANHRHLPEARRAFSRCLIDLDTFLDPDRHHHLDQHLFPPTRFGYSTPLGWTRTTTCHAGILALRLESVLFWPPRASQFYWTLFLDRYRQIGQFNVKEFFALFFCAYSTPSPTPPLSASISAPSTRASASGRTTPSRSSPWTMAAAPCPRTSPSTRTSALSASPPRTRLRQGEKSSAVGVAFTGQCTNPLCTLDFNPYFGPSAPSLIPLPRLAPPLA